MTLLQNGKQVKYTCENGKVTVILPQGLKNEALAFSFRVKNRQYIHVLTQLQELK